MPAVRQRRSYRHAHGDAADPHAERLQQFGQIDGGRFTFDVRVGGENHFPHLVAAHSLQQTFYMQVVWPYPFERRQRAHEHVIGALEIPCLLDRRHVVRIFDHADQLPVSSGIGAIETGIAGGDV